MIVPRLGQVIRIPMAMSALALGILLNWAESGHGTPDTIAQLSSGAKVNDTIRLLSTVSITLLFLFAGLEIDLREFVRQWRLHLRAMALHAMLAVGVALGVSAIAPIPIAVCALFAIGIVTPSAGFILDSLPSMGVPAREKVIVKSAAIGFEVSSLLILLVVSKIHEPVELSAIVAGMGLLSAILPWAWKHLRRTLFVTVERSEFVFLFVLAMGASSLSQSLGLYYIFGAFFTGVLIGTLHGAGMDRESRRMLHAIELMTTLFLPVYFFRAGLRMPLEVLTPQALMIGGACLLAVPLRAVPIVASYGHAGLLSGGGSLRVATAIAPTLVFGLVMAGVVHGEYPEAPALAGALVTYTLLSTLVPSIFLRARPTEMDPFHEPADVPWYDPFAQRPPASHTPITGSAHLPLPPW